MIAASSRSRSSARERLQRRVRRELGPVQRVVGVAATDAGDRALVAEDRVHAPAVVGRCGATAANSSLVDLGTEPRERAVVAGREHPPARLALGAELAHQHRLVAGELPAHHRPLRLRALRRLLEVDAAGLREVEHDAALGCAENSSSHVLRPPADAGERAPTSVVGRRHRRLQAGEPERLVPLERRAAQPRRRCARPAPASAASPARALLLGLRTPRAAALRVRRRAPRPCRAVAPVAARAPVREARDRRRGTPRPTASRSRCLRAATRSPPRARTARRPRTGAPSCPGSRSAAALASGWSRRFCM